MDTKWIRHKQGRMHVFVCCLFAYVNVYSPQLTGTTQSAHRMEISPPFPQLFIHIYIRLFVRSFTHSLFHLLPIHSFMDSFIIHSSIHPPIYPFTHPHIHTQIHQSMCVHYTHIHISVHAFTWHTHMHARRRMSSTRWRGIRRVKWQHDN